ncbi:transposase family protein [Streptomyces olivoreticuli]
MHPHHTLTQLQRIFSRCSHGHWSSHETHLTRCQHPSHLGGTSLTAVEKNCNRAHSSIRSAVERCISHLKNWKPLSENYRGPLDRFPETLDTVIQLELLRTWTTP